MITVNNITYILRGSSEDNGKYSHYYYTDTVTASYNIIYEGQRGTISTSTLVYIDEDTDQIFYKDYFSYILKYGSTTRAATCLNSAEEQKIQDIIDNYKVEDDGDTSHNDGDNSNSNNDNNNNNNNNNNNGNDDGNNTSDSLNGDTAEDGDSSLGTGTEDSTKNIFDDTMGSSNQKNIRDSLPRGSNLYNDNVLPSDIDQRIPASPKDTNLKNKGTTYPIIRINDHYYYDSEILNFSMETGYYKDYYDYGTYKMPMNGFIPTMSLTVSTTNQAVLKQDHVKQGDRCSVFFSSDNNMVKSMRCDFRITNVITNKMDQNRVNHYITQIITGELYVPDLRNEAVRYNFNGSSRDAMMDVAKRLRLSFFFCDPDDTNDVMVWCNCRNPEMFIKDLTVHAWKNADAFFESWIDPRYGLSFQNINRLLGESGYDEPLDVTFWINTFINNRAQDGKNNAVSSDSKGYKPQAKLLTNIPADDESATVYHINNWRMINNAQEIQDFIGLNCKMQYESINTGMTEGSSYYSVDYSLCINTTKFDPTADASSNKNDFYVLLGPGRNMTYASADDMMNQSETASSNTVAPQQITNQQSDGDAANIQATDGNMLSSGNTHKFYEVAYEHNMRNLLQLQKQYLDVELNGANLTIVRGEKIPVVLMDLNKADAVLKKSEYRTELEELLYEAESGWYIIDGIEWVFNPNYGSGTGTSWRTNVRLTRREWPIPGKDNSVKNDTSNEVNVTNNIDSTNTVKAAYDSTSGTYMLDEVVVTASKPKSTTDNTSSVSSSSEETTGLLYTANGVETVSSLNFNLDLQDQYVMTADKVQNSTIPLTGLKTYMKDIYRAIAEASNNKVKLVSARRWAVDEYGNKVDGNAFVKKNGYYKCMNAIGETMYFKKNNSRHLYGEAIDIINNGIDFTDLMTSIIMKDKSTLQLMYENGVSAYIEQAKDDTGTTTKHYHIGTDTIKQKEFWSSVKTILGSDKIPGTIITFSNYMKNNNTASTEVTYADVDETSLKK